MKLHLITTEAIRADCFGEPIRFSETNYKILGLPGGSDGKESACDVGDLGSIPGMGTSPGEGNGNPLQYSCLENSMNCIVHGVAKSWTQLGDFYFHQVSRVYFSSSC